MIKWRGLDKNGDPWDNTWEPAENIEKTATSSVKDFKLKKKSEIDKLYETAIYETIHPDHLPFDVRNKLKEFYGVHTEDDTDSEDEV